MQPSIETSSVSATPAARDLADTLGGRLLAVQLLGCGAGGGVGVLGRLGRFLGQLGPVGQCLGVSLARHSLLAGWAAVAAAARSASS
jgi:hypothetical protein